MAKHIFLIISLTAVMLSFFLGYLYAYREYIVKTEKISETIYYIDVSTSTKNITIKNTPENIRFRVNGEIMHTGSIDLK